ncbi:hypothetical protein K438DRAFT_2000062 [Mycena galopus ATCC 62051]|nr:hypothetical protein K438DRAFT_2000062 [Mycena galopus ATCC 62051]
MPRQMVTDHVAPFLLTKLLTPKLLAAATASYTPRVVFVASQTHAFGTGVNFDMLAHPDPQKYTSLDGYNQAKSANVLTGIELSKRSKGAINAYSLHPGGKSQQNSHRKEAMENMQALGLMGPDGRPNTENAQWKTISQGAATTVTAAFDPRLSTQPGAYLDDSTVANEKVAPHSSDPAKGEKLWALTEQIIGETFTF